MVFLVIKTFLSCYHTLRPVLLKVGHLDPLDRRTDRSRASETISQSARGCDAALAPDQSVEALDTSLAADRALG